MDDLDEAQGEYNALFEKWLGMNVASAVRPVTRRGIRYSRLRPSNYF